MILKRGIFDWFSYDLPFEDRIALIRQAGFDTVMLWWEDAENNPETARRQGLEIANIHVPFPDANRIWQEGLDGEDYYGLLLSGVEGCARHGIPTAVIHAYYSRSIPVLSHIGLDRFKRLVDAAERLEVNIAIENLRLTAPNEYLLGNIKSQRLGFCYDAGHQHAFTPDYDCLEHFGDQLFAVHLHDNCGDDDAHLLPFDGTIDWRNVMRKLRQCRPLDGLTLEADFNTNLPDAKRYVHLLPEAYLDLALERLGRLAHMLDEV